MTALGPGGKATEDVTVDVNTEPTATISLSPPEVRYHYPRLKHPEVGLLASEELVLSDLAKNFKDRAQYEKSAKLTLVAHADVRGSKKYNKALSVRRAEAVKDYLEAHGLSTDLITTRAMGKDEQLEVKKAARLEAKNPHKPAKWMRRDTRATWLAYNRRVDILLEPEGQPSAETYPDGARDARILWTSKEPSLKRVEEAARTCVSVVPSTPIRWASESQQSRAMGGGNLRTRAV